MFESAAMGLPITLALFAAAALAVWFVGVRITRYANAISGKAGMGQALRSNGGG